jgi:hypothetical protein
MEKIMCLINESTIERMFVEGYMFREKDFGRQEGKTKGWMKELLTSVS